MYLIKNGYKNERVVYQKKDKVKIAFGSEDEVNIFTEEEIKELLIYMKSNEVKQRDRMILYIFLYMGIRVGELVRLRIRDIDITKVK